MNDDGRQQEQRRKVSAAAFDGQRASLGRVVWLRDELGDSWTGLIVGVTFDDRVDLVTWGPDSEYRHRRVPYAGDEGQCAAALAEGVRVAWQWPPRV